MNYPVSKDLFMHPNDLIYLNHASFGATPKSILNKFNEITTEMENNPMKFFLEDYAEMFDVNRESIYGFINCRKENLAFVDNASTGVATVIRSLMHEFDSDWEILTTDHYYPAIKNTLKYAENITECSLNVLELPDFIESEEQIIELLTSSITEKTKLLVVDHISSISAIRFPVKEIVKKFHDLGIPVLVDAAHAPGYIDIDIQAINPDFYIGNLHKWLFTPKGTAILYSSEKWLDKIHPLTISNNYGDGYTAEFDWVGTKNNNSYFVVKDAIDFHKQYFNYDYCRNLSLYARNEIISQTGLKPMVNESLTDLMQSFYLPNSVSATHDNLKRLRVHFYRKYNIEIFLYPFKDNMIIRTSSQIYNSQEEYDVLMKAIKDLI